jgi:hypothetical protein
VSAVQFYAARAQLAQLVVGRGGVGDQVHVYDRALSAAEVAQLYESGR